MKTTKPDSPRKINQPKGWKDSVGIGFLGAKGAQGQHVPLVFVHDLAAWMLASKPLKQVTQDICTAIELHGLDGLFFTQTDDWAIACAAPSEWDAFAGKTDASKIAARFGVAWNMSPWELERLVNTPGQKVEFSAENSSPFEFSRRKGSPTSSIAVTYDLAHKLWGWGTVDAAAVDANAAGVTDLQAGVPEAAPAKPKAKERISLDWKSEETKAAFLDAFEKAPGNSAAKKFKYLASTGEWGVGADRLKQHYRDISSSSTMQPKKVVNSVFEWRGKS